MKKKSASYRWLFVTYIYTSSVNKALKSGLVKSKTEYAMHLWLVYHHNFLQYKRFEEGNNINYGFSWTDTPQGRDFWLRIWGTEIG
jgi:hypothetical protein